MDHENAAHGAAFFFTIFKDAPPDVAGKTLKAPTTDGWLRWLGECREME